MWNMFLACIILMTSSIYLFPAHQIQGQILEVVFLNCGQGDSILIITPDQLRILVDTCPDGAITTQQVQNILGFGERRIDMLILTHADNDHVGGLEVLLQRYDVRSIIAPIYTISELSPHVRHLMAAQHISTFSADAKQDLILGELSVDILYPDMEYLLDDASDNNGSLIAMLHFGTQRLLLTGDAEAPLEEHLLTMGMHLQAHVLKGGHHGSKTSSTPAFLQAVTPDTVVFQNGAGNSFGHPHPDVVARFEEQGIPVYNTSTNGTVRARCSMDTCTITTDTS